MDCAAFGLTAVESVRKFYTLSINQSINQPNRIFIVIKINEIWYLALFLLSMQ